MGGCLVLVLAGSLSLAPGTVHERAAALRARGGDAVYNLDYPEALSLLNQAIALDPSSSANERALATALWLHIVFERGAVTVDQYLGGVSRQDVTMEKAPPDEAAAFARHAGRALLLADEEVAGHPKDAAALFDLGASLGLMASYDASVDGKVRSAFGAARRAFDAHEEVLALDAARKDAGLIVGTYRYLVSTLDFPMRWMAYLAGFGGDGALGIRMIEAAARYPGESQTDAKVALLLLYNRERRYADAMSVARDLIARYPRNRLFVLEAASTELRAGRPGRAMPLLDDGIARLAADHRPRAFGEEALWYYKRGLAHVELRDVAQAAADLDRARGLPARTWVKARIALERGRLADLTGHREVATAAYDEAIRLADAGHDEATRAAASRYRKSPYR